MSQLSEKELSAINELLHGEELLVKEVSDMLAQHSEDQEIKSKFENIAEQHQSHFNMLYRELG